MEILVDLLQILVPAALVLYAMYATIKVLLEKQFEQKQIELRYKNAEIINPIRLQAYERMALFLERITPNNLLLRTNGKGSQVLDYQQLILSEIREEYNHNLSQQIYMSNEVWDKVKTAMNNVMTLINQSSAELQPDAPAIDLSKKVFENIIQNNPATTSEALLFLKQEVQKSYSI